ncbi:MAG: tetratricopeptide repeat protein, partial [Planctomycetes bacterium]|nr:tetratricopeptide repeat protein [Planctomycetota bacterium]
MTEAKPRIPSGRRSAAEPSQVLPVVFVIGPALLLAWPGYGAWIVDDPLPHLSSAALAALVALLAAAWTLVRGREPALLSSALFLSAVLCGAAAVSAGRVTDSLEARRAWCIAALGFSLLCAGGSLRPAARANLGRALPLLALAFLIPALGSHAFGGPRGLGGVLGNSGALSLAALPGVGAGAWLLLHRPGAWRWVGLCACAAFAAHALLAPVLTGVVALAAVLAALALAPTSAARGMRVWPLAGALLLGLGAWFAVQRPAAGEAAPTAVSSSAQLGGFEVRQRLWSTLPAILEQAPLLGLGPGQFQAAYPPLRDREELELSTHQRSSGDFSEVEHLHNDWLQGLAELGLIGGSAWILLLAAGAWSAWSALRGGDPTRALAASALVPLLVGAAANAPFTYVPAAGAQGFALLGLLLGHATRPAEESARPRWQRYSLRALPLCFGLLALPSMIALLEHGRALTNRGSFVAWAAADPRTDLAAARLRERGYIDKALRACPRSAVAHALLARHRAEDPLQREQELEAWRAVLAERPHQAEALFRCGLLHASAGRTDDARAAWERLLEIDPEHPITLRNLALLEARAGNTEKARACFDRLEQRQRLSVDWLRSTAGGELLGGRLDAGLLFAARAEAWTAPPTPELLDAAGIARAKIAADLYAEALRAAAQWKWGREQLAAGASADA